MWMRSAILCVVALLGTWSGAQAEDSECGETIEGDGVSGSLIGNRFVTSDGGANAIVLQEVGIYQLDDGSSVTVSCAGWLVYWADNGFHVLEL